MLPHLIADNGLIEADGQLFIREAARWRWHAIHFACQCVGLSRNIELGCKGASYWHLSFGNLGFFIHLREHILTEYRNQFLLLLIIHFIEFIEFLILNLFVAELFLNVHVGHMLFR